MGETGGGDGVHYQGSMGDILTSGKGQVLAVFSISQRDPLADEFGTWDDRWSRVCDTLARESVDVRQPTYQHWRKYKNTIAGS